MPVHTLPRLSDLLDEHFSEQYARARQIQAFVFVDEIMDIADDASSDWVERKDEDDETIGRKLNRQHVQRARVKVDTRKWYLSKLLPRRFG